MNRLRDEHSSTDAILAEAARLARSVSVSEPPVGLQQRMRAALVNRRRRSVGMRLRPAMAMIILASLIAVSAAAAVQLWKRHAAVDKRAADQRSAPTTSHRAPAPVMAQAPTVSAEELSPVAVQRARPGRRVPSPDVASTPPSERPSLEVPAEPQENPPPGEPKSAELLPMPEEAPALPSPNRVAAAEREAVLVLDATRALHHDHDPRRALKLLAEYRRRFPEGDLLEESLALAIEANSARNDRSAASLAKQYIDRFPTGRFREQAVRAQLRFGR